MKWISLHGYHHSTRRWSHGADVWTARCDVAVKKIALFASYARSRDTLDLRSVGLGKVLNDPTNEYCVGTTLPLGRHGLTISLTRFEDADTRHTITLTYRWSLAAAPWSFAGETEPAVTPVTPGPGTDGLP